MYKMKLLTLINNSMFRCRHLRH